MEKYYVTYQIFAKGQKKPVLEYTTEYRRQDEIHIKMKEYREFGVMVKTSESSVDWYPITSIDRISYETFMQ